jgi:MFS family permease
LDRPVRLGRRFGWLWAAYAVSTFGTWLGFNAFTLIAISVLHAGPAAVSGLAAAGLAVGAVVALPLGPWVEFRRKRRVMIGMDLTRFAALVSIPAAFALGALSYVQLVVVAVVVAAADITFQAAAGAYLKSLVRPEELVVANGRFESTMWTATAIGPPVGGFVMGLFGPVTTVVVDAVSYLLSAAGIRAIGRTEPRPQGREQAGLRVGELVDGWRFLLSHRVLRPLLVNTVLVNGLIMAGSPVLAVLMLADLGFTPWQYGLAIALACLGGLVGSRLAQRLVARFGRLVVLRVAGVLRACWPVGLAFVQPGVGGLVLVIVVELGLITCASVYNTVLAAFRLEQVPTDRVARTLSAWSISTKISIAATTALWGVLAAATDPRTALAAAGVLLLATPLLLRKHHFTHPAPASQKARLM